MYSFGLIRPQRPFPNTEAGLQNAGMTNIIPTGERPTSW
jgi:hypothetical protein